MKLTEFNSKPSLVAKKALKENFNTNLNLDALNLRDTVKMLSKVKGLISEMKTSNKAHSREQNPAYLKLTFMEQALSHHYGELKALPMYNQRIIVENEEVEKSQVVLAAQEMIDEMQKMIENVSDMLVKELPAVTDGVNAEFGTSEGEQFTAQAGEALGGLQAALTQAKAGLQSAIGIITGQGGMDMAGGMGGEELGGMPGEELGGDDMGDMGNMDADVPSDDIGDMADDEEDDIMPAVGRSTR